MPVFGGIFFFFLYMFRHTNLGLLNAYIYCYIYALYISMYQLCTDEIVANVHTVL